MSSPLAERVRGQFPDGVTVPEPNGSPEVAWVAPGALPEVCRFCRDDSGLDLQVLSCLSGVDYADRIELVYHLISYRRQHELVLKVRLDRDRPQAPSVAAVWPAANWHEREIFDLLGVTFDGHPDLRRLLLPDDWVGYPLRKDYVPPTEYHGISHQRADPLRPAAPEASSGKGVPSAS